jgi:redox-sensing transcriptional repressor
MGVADMKHQKISDAVVRRLPIYLRFLSELSHQNIQTVSSAALGQKLDMNPAQIRKDLAYFGEFGQKGVGYDVEFLIDKIRQILKLDQQIFVALVGAGNLGKALCNYNTYLKDNMKIVAVFDASEHKVGERMHDLTVQPMAELQSTIRERAIRIGIITVPAEQATIVAQQFAQAGIEAILNFAPVKIKVAKDIRVHNADFTTELQSLAYYLDE